MNQKFSKTVFLAMFIFCGYKAFSTTISAKTVKATTVTASSESAKVVSADQSADVTYPVAPKVKKGEYALFLKDKYIVFKTQKTSEGFEFDRSCFAKSKKPNCMASTYAKMKAENVQVPHPDMNNRAAFHCAKMNGRNLLAIDFERNEVDFCRFPDNSMVSSWSMYLYHNPMPVIK